jgi:hypothetical protein
MDDRALCPATGKCVRDLGCHSTWPVPVMMLKVSGEIRGVKILRSRFRPASSSFFIGTFMLSENRLEILKDREQPVIK